MRRASVAIAIVAVLLFGAVAAVEYIESLHAGSATIYGTTSLGGDTTIGGDATVSGDITGSGDGSLAGGLTITGNDALLLSGDATCWDDLRVPISATRLEGTKDPDFSKVFDDAAGTSQGVFAYLFDKTIEEEVYFSVQLPHTYVVGSDIEPHIHWFPVANGGAGKSVSWGLEYVWVSIGGTFGDTTIIYADTTVQGDSSLVAAKHYMTDFSDIDGTSQGISSMLLCRVFRDAAGAGGTDDYDDDAGLLEIDFHFQVDRLGSRTEYTK